MALTPAERKRRSRRHTSGDHSLCDPAKCESAGDPLPDELATGDALGARGRRLWREMTAAADGALGPAQLVLLEEACRIADRLDRLDKVLRRRDDSAWLELLPYDDGRVLRVVVDNALAEARQQASALRLLVAELSKATARKPAAAGEEAEPDALDELRERRDQRVAGSTP